MISTTSEQTTKRQTSKRLEGGGGGGGGGGRGNGKDRETKDTERQRVLQQWNKDVKHDILTGALLLLKLNFKMLRQTDRHTEAMTKTERQKILRDRVLQQSVEQGCETRYIDRRGITLIKIQF